VNVSVGIRNEPRGSVPMIFVPVTRLVKKSAAVTFSA
jgi:hypothetical protein